MKRMNDTVQTSARAMQAALAASFVCLAMSGQAKTIFRCDFENDATNAQPVAANAYNGPGQTLAYTLYQAGGSGVYLVEDDGSTSNKALRIRMSLRAITFTPYTTPAVVLSNMPPGQKIVISFDVRQNTWVSPDKMSYRSLGWHSEWGYDTTHTLAYHAAGSSYAAMITYSYENSNYPYYTIDGSGLQVSRWYNITKTIYASGKYDCYITDKTNGHSGGFTNHLGRSKITTIRGLVVGPENATSSCDMLIDNITMTVESRPGTCIMIF